MKKYICVLLTSVIIGFFIGCIVQYKCNTIKEPKQNPVIIKIIEPQKETKQSNFIWVPQIYNDKQDNSKAYWAYVNDPDAKYIMVSMNPFTGELEPNMNKIIVDFFDKQMRDWYKFNQKHYNNQNIYYNSSFKTYQIRDNSNIHFEY